MPLKEEHLNDIDEIRNQIKEVVVSFLMESEINKKPGNYVAFTAYEITDLKKKQILDVSKLNGDLVLRETAEAIGEVEIALESIIKEQDAEEKAGKKSNGRGCYIKKIEWRGEVFYRAKISRMR